MISRVVDQSEIESMISAGEEEKNALEERLRATQERLKTLYAVRDFVTLGPENFRTSLESPDPDAGPSSVGKSASGSISTMPPSDSSVADLVDYVLRLHCEEVKRTGKTPGMRPSEISKKILKLFHRKIETKPINGRLWYLKSRNMVGWRENFYYLLDTETAS
jgi:hypothetical protein